MFEVCVAMGRSPSAGPTGGEGRGREARVPRGERRERGDGSVWPVGEFTDHPSIHTVHTNV